MNFRRKILLDRLVALPVSFALNMAAWGLGKLLRRDHSATAATRVIVVAKLVGMGSAVQVIPLLRGLREHFPGARIVFLTLQGNRSLLERISQIDEIICLDDGGAVRMVRTTVAVLSTMMRLRVDHFLDLEVYSAFTSILAMCSLARNRVGFYRHTSRNKRGNYTHLVYFNTHVPVRLLYVQLGRSIGMPPRDDLPDGIAVSAADHEGLMRELPALAAVREPMVLLNPNASDLLLERRWPREHVMAAIEELARRGVTVVLSGARGEAPYVAQIHAALSADVRRKVIDSAGKLSFGSFLALLQRAAVVITNDTGPMHFAVALHRPVVCLFGPGNPTHYAVPQRADVVSIYAQVSCSPCIYEVDIPPCRGDNVCMQRISPQLVVEAAAALLDAAARPADSTTHRLPLVWDHPDSHMPLGVLVRPAA
jgi:heptosyltransferase II